jgi:hypothetical protein
MAPYSLCGALLLTRAYIGNIEPFGAQPYSSKSTRVGYMTYSTSNLQLPVRPSLWPVVTVSPYVCSSGNNSNCNALTHGDMVSLDEGRFPALELNNRRLSVKNSFCRKNGVYTRSVTSHGHTKNMSLAMATPRTCL